MEKWNKFCCIFSLLTLGAQSVHAQTSDHTTLQGLFPVLILSRNLPFAVSGPLSFSTGNPLFANILQKNDNWGQFKSSEKRLPAVGISVSPLTAHLLPANFSLQHMAFFCRQEWKCEKATGIPLRFRVGSLQECDWLEQKPDALPPGK